MYEYMRQGGALMWIIASLSLAAAAVAAERILFFIKASANPVKIEREFGQAMSQGDLSGAWKIVEGGDTSMHRLFKSALAHWSISGDDMKLMLEQLVRHEIYRWGKHLYILEIIGKAAPLLGLLGTVLGMVEMFHSLHIGGQVSASAVTGGIWKALFTTVAGLAVAIPTIFVHGLLSSRIDREEEKLQMGSDFLLREHNIKSEGTKK
ncbi:MAG: MotA/TolQ/ExbB proton channel family protein [Synergistes sp.]|nr:MotA/TolQ/ExbB proton channel family protein [Synergistes sp.]